MDDMKQQLEIIREKMQDAALRSKRNIDDIKLMAVSKTRPVEDIQKAYDLGLRLFGENRVLEAKEKFELMPEDAELHIIGHLQRNKAKAAASAASCIHSIDKLSTAEALNKQAAGFDKTLRVLLEVNTSGEESKGGVVDYNILAPLIEGIGALENLKLSGLMTMAPYTEDTVVVRNCFRRLYQLREELAKAHGQLDFSELSMGMSSDYEIAIEEGSTLIRVGTLLFGTRG